jgi:hypothetical protein
VQAQIRFRKLKEGFEEHIQELRAELKEVSEDLREELELLHVQTNNRLFFGTTHSVSRYATKLTSYRPPPEICYRPPLEIVAGGWSADNKVLVATSLGNCAKWSALAPIQTPEGFFTLTESDGVVTVKEVKSTC